MPKALILLFLLSLAGSAGAHPVIFQGGTVVSSANMPSLSDNQLMYSWTSRWATGFNHWRFSEGQDNTELYLAKANYLLYRKNAEASQGNVYLHAGAGAVDSELDRRATEEVYMAGVDLDWETRTLYTSLKSYYFSSPGVTDLTMTQARVGVSPFEAAYDQLQAWVMLQAMYTPEVQREVMLTPLLRFFYRNVLWELGASTRGDWMLNLMVHY